MAFAKCKCLVDSLHPRTLDNLSLIQPIHTHTMTLLNDWSHLLFSTWHFNMWPKGGANHVISGWPTCCASPPTQRQPLCINILERAAAQEGSANQKIGSLILAPSLHTLKCPWAEHRTVHCVLYIDRCVIYRRNRLCVLWGDSGSVVWTRVAFGCGVKVYRGVKILRNAPWMYCFCQGQHIFQAQNISKRLQMTVFSGFR